MYNLNQLCTIIPKHVVDNLLAAVTPFGIHESALRLGHFLAQCMHESANFTKVEEDLRYRRERLLEIFPTYFTKANVDYYVGHPDRIANLVYGSRMGNRGYASGDGFAYIARGYLGLTGLYNYAGFDLYVTDSILQNPQLVATKYPLLSAAWVWDDYKLNYWADKNDLEKITRIVNGGFNGLEERKLCYAKLSGVFNV